MLQWQIDNRENIYQAIAFLNSFTVKIAKFTQSLGGRIFHDTEALHRKILSSEIVFHVETTKL